MQQLMFRAIDITLSLVGLTLTLPAMLIIYIFILFDTGSPLFFQKRVGKNQKQFTLIKFRTMSIDTDSIGTHLVSTNSITKSGLILRKTKLDELPQLLNVLHGDMSMVGPRPCLTNQTKLIEERVHRGIFNVRPGITGLSQINKVDMSTPRKLARYDQLMINEMSPRLYISLITSTLLGKGLGDRVKKHSDQ